MQWTYTIGIDLGTSNSALTWQKSGETRIYVLDIPQLSAPGNTSSYKTLASVIYFPTEGELSSESARLPWQQLGDTSSIAGNWARNRSIEAPDRCVSSAKSWLCNKKVNREDSILPWKSEFTSQRISPIKASEFYLSYLKDSFQHDRESAGEVIDWSTINVTLTVPASFDDVARSLTQRAAEGAGLQNLSLLEEPQAAFYSRIASEERDWREEVDPGDLVLVLDIGGGTTDFSLISINDNQGNLELERVSVGDHLLLGGDNMDLALAYALQETIEETGKSLDHWQFQSLVGSCRDAKETILADEQVSEYPISIASKGSSLFATSISAKLTRSLIEQILRDGFFPLTTVADLPENQISTGLKELGLDYENEPAITKHLAKFLAKSYQNINSDQKLKELIGSKRNDSTNTLLIPNKILFNGGVLKASMLRSQILQLLGSWKNDSELKEIYTDSLDLAVAKGATYFGSLKSSKKGLRIKSGISRSYYLGLESTGMAIPGRKPKIKGLCVVPQGTEEGSHLESTEKQFGLMTGEEVEFRFFSSSIRAGDRVGTEISDAMRDLDESARLSATLTLNDDNRKTADETTAEKEKEAGAEPELVPVTLDALITEVGTLQLFLKHKNSDKKWNLEFNVRNHD